MQKISTDTEKKLMRCIEKASALIADGESPSNGIAKAAIDCGVRPGEVKLVVHAYNTGQTAKQRESSTDLFDKAADFPLADTDVVLNLMYPDREKAAAAATAVHADPAAHPVYTYSPRSFLERRAAENRAGGDWGKMAGVTAAPTAYPTDPEEARRKAAAVVQRAKVAAAELRRKAADAKDAMAKRFMALTDYFRRADAIPIATVKEAAIMLHGDVASRLFEQLVEVTPGLLKLANQRGRHVDVGALNCTAAPFDIVASMLDAVDVYKREKAAYTTAQQHYETEANKIVPFVQPAASPSVLGPSSDSGVKRAFANPLATVAAAGGLSSIFDRVGQQAAKTKSQDVQRELRDLDDPKHENQLRQITAQSMLQDFMLNDPVVSGYQHDEVLNAYNDISQLAPRASGQPLLMQTLLRKQLQQGQLDTFDLDQLLGLEGKLQQRELPAVKGVGADGSVI